MAKLPSRELTDYERETLTRWTRCRTSAQALAQRARVVLACAEGGPTVTSGAPNATSPDGGAVAATLCDQRLGGRARRAPPRSPTPNDRRRRGAGADVDLGDHAPRRDALEHPIAREAVREEPDRDHPHLAGLCPPTPPPRDL